MSRILLHRFAREPDHVALRRDGFLLVSLVVTCLLLAAACRSVRPLDTSPLDNSGMTYDTIQQLKAVKITAAEVPELVKARQAGFSDAACVQVIQIFRGRGGTFSAGDTVAGLLQAGIGEGTVLELARLNQLGFDSGELQAMRLAGLSDAIILAVAQHHAEGKPVLSGASLATMKNAGFRESTLFELARRGVPDSRAGAMISLRRHRVSDAEILRRFSGS
jgi:hypothetical protein